ncbi:MAG: S23 ribosomal protein [Candidatus Peregrinibacteria bacterium GW2011_GWF2_38_29]|nr:MAG: S23 ribosomal protein [Candidatus Peregrinibacteria bacterium GW2011_GWF2_38_29]HBB02369.1 four helix bundle protein [Candidatus Peregrinibacteria bacterium]
MEKYDLMERTTKFGLSVLIFAKQTQSVLIEKEIIQQLIKSGTSIGANYCEADHAESKKDFIHKIGICRKEAKETKYWLIMAKVIFPQFKAEIDQLLLEATELNLIFSAIFLRTSRKL